MFEQRLRQRRKPTDAAVQRIRFVFSDDTIRAALAVRSFDGYARAEPHEIARLFFRPHNDRRIETLLQILSGMLVGGRLCRSKLLRKAFVSRRCHVIRMLTLRTLCDDFGLVVVFFDKCAAHGKLTYTRFLRKQDGCAVNPVPSERF